MAYIEVEKGAVFRLALGLWQMGRYLPWQRIARETWIYLKFDIHMSVNYIAFNAIVSYE